MWTPWFLRSLGLHRKRFSKEGKCVFNVLMDVILKTTEWHTYYRWHKPFTMLRINYHNELLRSMWTSKRTVSRFASPRQTQYVNTDTLSTTKPTATKSHAFAWSDRFSNNRLPNLMHSQNGTHVKCLESRDREWTFAILLGGVWTSRRTHILVDATHWFDEYVSELFIPLHKRDRVPSCPGVRTFFWRSV